MDSLTDMQRAILDALQRPLREDGPYATPATNKQIAAEVHLSVDAVKGHLRALYARLGLDQLPQNAKRARLAEIGISGAVDGALPPRPPTLPVAAPVPAVAVPAPGQRGRLPAMLAAVGLGLVLLGVVVGLVLGHDGGDTIISQAPGFDRPGSTGHGHGGKGTLLGGLPGPWSDDGLFAAGPPVRAGDVLVPGVAGAAPRRSAEGRHSDERGAVRGVRERSPSPAQRQTGAPAPAGAPTTPAVTTTPTSRARRACTTRRRVRYRPVTVTVPRVRAIPRRVRVRVRVVRYRTQVRMVPVTRQVPNRQGRRRGARRSHAGGGTHTETVHVRQVRRVPVVHHVTHVRRTRQVRYVKVTRRQRVMRMVRRCRRV